MIDGDWGGRERIVGEYGIWRKWDTDSEYESER